MEITYEQAYDLVQKSLNERPEMKAVFTTPDFKSNLEWVLTHEGVGLDHFETVQNQILLVLACYSPVSSLGKNIAEGTSIPLETAESIANLVESILLEPVMELLTAFDFEWSEQSLVPQADSTLKEKLELRPEGVEQVAKPLTREELLSALSSKRTMASDMARVQGAVTPAAAPSTPADGK